MLKNKKIKDVVCMYSGILLSHKKEKIMPFAAIWMDLEIIIGTPLQYSHLENPMDRGAWWAAVPGVAKSQIRLSDFTFTFWWTTVLSESFKYSYFLTK